MKTEAETTAFFVKTNQAQNKINPFEQCVLCNQSSHGINKCSKYRTASEKIVELNKMKACVKCASTNHCAKDCKFRFKKACFFCNKWHFTFICPEAKPNVKSAIERKQGENKDASKGTSAHITQAEFNAGNESNDQVEDTDTVCSVVSANFFQKNFQEVDSILSTFTAKCNDDSVIRGMYDIGSQSSFIVEDLVNNVDHVVIKENINLTIKGINESKTMKSKLIEAQLKLGDAKFPVRLLTVPEININLKLPNLHKVVTSLVQKGHTLADTQLNENSVSLDKIGIILGANAAYCFQGETVKLGNNSVYLTTKFGTMLLGSIKNILKDISDLDESQHVKQEHLKDTNDEQTNSFAIGLGFEMNSINIANVQRAKDEQYTTALKDVNSMSFDNCPTKVLEDTCSYHLNKESSTDVEEDSNLGLIKHILDNSDRSEDGRMRFPLIWNPDVKHLLSKNFNLAKCVLNSNLKKFSSDKDKLYMIDDNIKDLESANIIEKIQDLDTFMEQHPTCSFLAHNSIFKPNKETSKVRIVFMSNLAEKSKEPNNLSHNQCMFSGPSINQKLSTALTQLRFDEKLLCFDIKKAFCQIELPEDDKNKLMFLWFKNVKQNDFTVEAFRNTRLSFGLRCSPTILMIALYKMLILDEKNSDLVDLKKQIYALTYMDNGAITMSNSHDLMNAYNLLPGIFGEYKFELQQFVTNDVNLKPLLEDKRDTTELFGIQWDTKKDVLSPKDKILDLGASTKRKLLKSIAENFDPFNYDGPVLNRARLFMHELQCEEKLGWDQDIGPEHKREWKNICNQINNASPITIDRCVGSRKDVYKLVCFTDASKNIYGCVIYLKNINTNQTKLLLAKNRIVGKAHEGKSIPSLELSAIVLGTETLVDVQKELTGKQNILPVRIEEACLYTDSLVCLNWLNSHVNKLDKLSKLSVFVKNRLNKVQKMCDEYPITFSFVDGIENPADLMTRATSYKTLKASNWVTGPKFLTTVDNEMSRMDILTFCIPNKKFGASKSLRQEDNKRVEVTTTPIRQESQLDNQSTQLEIEASQNVVEVESLGRIDEVEATIGIKDYSSFSKTVRITGLVLKFINKLKLKLKNKFPDKFGHLKVVENTWALAKSLVIITDQKKHFKEVFDFFDKSEKGTSKMPNIIRQLNCFVDNKGLVRVGNKMRQSASLKNNYCPILLSKSSELTNKIIKQCHESMLHSGAYVVLAEIRKQYWIPSCFNTVRKVLQACVHCKRFNARAIKLNQNDYRKFRLNPNQKPFASIALDYAGPFNTRTDNKTSKTYLLVITCLYTRAINVVVTINLTTEEFLRAFQLHTFEYGLPEFVLSDMGSQIVAGADIIQNFLNESKTLAYFQEYGCEKINFYQYTKGNHALGGLIETCVKAVKRLISGAIRNNVLKFREFEFIIKKTVSLVNKRPIAFKEALRDNKSSAVPQAITPELLLHGFELPSLDIIPNLHEVNIDDSIADENFDPIESIQNTDKKLKGVKSKLFKLYHDEFIPHLIQQATDKKSRFQPKVHKTLMVGDVVLIKEENTKRANLPLGIVEKVTTNQIGEVTDTLILKGSTKERIRRHPTVLIPLLQSKEVNDNSEKQSLPVDKVQESSPSKPKSRRLAALKSRERSRMILNDN